MPKSTCAVVVCDRPARRYGLCNAHATWSYKHGRQMPTHAIWPRGNPSEVVRRRSAVDPATGCHNWTGWKDAKGYGRCGDTGTRQQQAHRLAWVVANGPIPAGLTVDHLCRNTSCVNVAHMELVTASENSRRKNEDRRDRGR